MVIYLPNPYFHRTNQMIPASTALVRDPECDRCDSFGSGGVRSELKSSLLGCQANRKIEQEWITFVSPGCPMFIRIEGVNSVSVEAI
jgi:hypothetical protein